MKKGILWLSLATLLFVVALCFWFRRGSAGRERAISKERLYAVRGQGSAARAGHQFSSVQPDRNFERSGDCDAGPPAFPNQQPIRASAKQIGRASCRER